MLDGYEPGSDAGGAGKECSVEESFRKPTTVYPRTLRGGSFVSEADLCDSASRLATDDESWKEEDPNYPQSPWWYTGYEGLGAGMRIVRPWNSDVTPQEKQLFWDADLDSIREVAYSRIDSNGRGAIGAVDEELDEDLEKLKKQ